MMVFEHPFEKKQYELMNLRQTAETQFVEASYSH